ncbi:hypothetical protein Tco_0497011 [Tanacetum coccineum]
MGTPTQVCVRSCPNISALASRPFRCVKTKRNSLVIVIVDLEVSRVEFGVKSCLLFLPWSGCDIGAYWADNARQIPKKGDLRDYWIGISSVGDFLVTAPSYTSNRDPILRLCHKLIVCSIAGRSQAPEKVTVTDLFYLRWMDVGSVNIPYLLARYLRLFAAERKSLDLIFGGQFVARLAKHFGLLTEERLWGLTVIARALPVIDMAELVRLQICMEIDYTWDWVAMGLERQPNAMANVPVVAQDAPAVDEGDQAVPVPVQAPQQPPPPPPAAGKTMPQRLGRLEEEVQRLRQDVRTLWGLVKRSVTDQGRFFTWMISCMTRLMEASGQTFQAFDGTFWGSSPAAFQRRTRQRTDGASTSIAQQDPQQPDHESPYPYLLTKTGIITEYLVNISKRRTFWSLNKDILKTNDSDNQYAVSIKEDMAYSGLHSPKTTKETSSIRRIQRRPIRRIEDLVCEYSGRYETWSLLQENSNTPLLFRDYKYSINEKNAYELKGKFLDDLHNNAFSGTNGKDAVEHIEHYLKIINPIKLPNIDHDKLRIVVFPISLAGGARRWFDRTKESITCWVDLTAKFFGKYYPPSRIEGNNRPKMGGDEIEVSNDESSDLKEYWSDKEEETAKIFKIETDIFDYETPLCLSFDEFNYLLKVDPNLLTKDIIGFKTYEDYKDDWIYEWNENVPWVYDKPWLDNGIWKELKPVKHTCKPFNYKTRCSEWPTYSWREDGYCNGGNLPEAYHIRNSLHYQDIE